MAEEFPGKIVVFTRDEEKRRYLRSIRVRNPGADIGPKTQPDLDASAHADTTVVLYNDAITIGDATTIATARGSWLEKHSRSLGETKDGATGATGFVKISAASGGTQILQDDEIKEPISGLRFRCAATALYVNNQGVPVTGISTGTETNLPVGMILEWLSPRPGCGPKATVVAQSDGSGFSGGHPDETDEEHANRLVELRANPPASGNDADYRQAGRKQPGIAIEEIFTVPCVKGPGTTAVGFTLHTDTPTASRLPNGAQRAAVLASLKTEMAGDDSIFDFEIADSDVAVVLKVTWARKAAGWVDAAPWPPLISAAFAVKVSGAAPITATSFRLTTTAIILQPYYTPQVGQTFAFYDAAKRKFQRKNIATVTVIAANRTWDITCNTTSAASDTSFTPIAGAIASPWSESLAAVVAPVTDYFRKLGPGEQVASLLDPGLRQRRQPESPEFWPNLISNNIVDPLFQLREISDAVLVGPTVPYATPVGVPAVLSYLLRLSDLAVLKQ